MRLRVTGVRWHSTSAARHGPGQRQPPGGRPRSGPRGYAGPTERRIHGPARSGRSRKFSRRLITDARRAGHSVFRKRACRAATDHCRALLTRDSIARRRTADRFPGCRPASGREVPLGPPGSRQSAERDRPGAVRVVVSGRTPSARAPGRRAWAPSHFGRVAERTRHLVPGFFGQTPQPGLARLRHWRDFASDRRQSPGFMNGTRPASSLRTGARRWVRGSPCRSSDWTHGHSHRRVPRHR